SIISAVPSNGSPNRRNAQRHVCPTPAAAGFTSHTRSRCGTILVALVRSARNANTIPGSALITFRFSTRDMRLLLGCHLPAQAGDVVNSVQLRSELLVNIAIDAAIALQQRRPLLLISQPPRDPVEVVLLVRHQRAERARRR